MSHKNTDPLPRPIPYGPEFTPGTLGKAVGEGRVLSHLLGLVSRHKDVQSLTQAIIEDCLQHVGGENPSKNKRDMASHVVQALQNYLLVKVEKGIPEITHEGRKLLDAHADKRDRLFARHILLRCNGLRIVDKIREFELRGETPSMESLNEAFGESRTSKSISAMKAWLTRGGVLLPGSRYRVDEHGIKDVLGVDVGLFFGLSAEDAAFLVAAKVQGIGKGAEELAAREVADLAELRSPEIRIPRKPLGAMVKRLAGKSLVEEIGKAKGVGGTQVQLKLTDQVRMLTEKELVSILEQGRTAFPLSDLISLEEVYEGLESSDTGTSGKAGEMLACHLVLILGLALRDWRKRAPHSEIDLVADRTMGLSYQRWYVQVKNTQGNVDIDRVDREIGAAAGLGVTHILFVAPRAGFSAVAKKQILAKSRLTSLHIYSLDRMSLAGKEPWARIVHELKSQESRLARLKREEAERREGQK